MSRLIKSIPWYAWFSSLAFFVLLMWIVVQFSLLWKEAKGAKGSGHIGLMVEFYCIVFLWGSVSLLPAIPIFVILTLLIPNFGEHGEAIREISMYVTLYLSGIFLTCKFDKWRKKKFLPYISKNDK